jgi:peptidoglycan-N-acetylglucosamine deacetylase
MPGFNSVPGSCLAIVRYSLRCFRNSQSDPKFGMICILEHQGMNNRSFHSAHSGCGWKETVQRRMSWGRTVLTILVVCAYFAPSLGKTSPQTQLQAASHPGPIELREPSRPPYPERAEAIANVPSAVARLPSRRSQLLSSTATPGELHVGARELQHEVERAGCHKSQNHAVLGVSRVIDIDTTGGPWFGGPGGNRELLAPGEVVLTFDDGPRPQSTRAILAALAAQCTSATFFMVGEMAREHPDVVREVAQQEHTIGTHTWSHLNLKRLPEDKMEQQIEAGLTGVDKAAGVPVAPFFRYPYLSSSKAATAYLQSRNIAQFAIDIDSFDWRRRNPPSIIRRVMSQLEKRGRGIVLLHDTYPSTAAAVPQLLNELNAKGYSVVHLRPMMVAQTLAGFDPPVTHTKHPRNHRHAQSHGRRGSRSRSTMW